MLFLPPDEVTEVLLDHFTNLHKKSTRGVVTIIPVRSDDVDLWPDLPAANPMKIEPWNGIAAGIGKTAFLLLKLDGVVIELLARMPILPTRKSEFNAHCIVIPKHYGKKSVRRRELRSYLVEGLEVLTNAGLWKSIKFETSHPESIARGEFYIAKILGAIRRKVRLQRGGMNIVFLKDISDCTDLIAFATEEWKKHKSKQRRKC